MACRARAGVRGVARWLAGHVGAIACVYGLLWALARRESGRPEGEGLFLALEQALTPTDPHSWPRLASMLFLPIA